ncbi:MAG: CPBP family glutamic-type intramembrane protease [Clostridia bacterium]|nr:CPBP family glutamic-type intramembrane protease [Clostridia bacterium]MDD4386149.1 CPBP family glutamic-type intramembrane protease [Clostridia bacterium]
MKNKLYRLAVLGIEQTLKMKFFIILNILMLVSIVGVVNFGSVKQIIALNTGDNVNKNILKIMVADDTARFTKLIQDGKIKDVEIIDYSEGGIKEGNALIEIKYDETNIINVKITSNEYIKDEQYFNIQTIINKIRTDIFSEKYEISLSETQQLNNDVKIERVVLTLNYSDYIKYQGVVTVIAFIMYMLFIFIAATISSTIGMEKISKTTEYMLTGISEKAYLWYNILQVNIVFVIQMILSGIYYLIANVINSILIIKFLGGNVTKIEDMVNLSLDPILFKIIILTIFQTVICVLILSIIQAIMTSKVNNMTDISNSSMLVIMIVIFVCFVCPNIINVSETVNIFVKIISCLPILSIVMIPKLILLHQISNIGIIIAVVVNIATLFILSIFGARWFKKGLLDSGNSRKADKRKKDEIYDMNKTKFKEIIFKISIAMLMYFVISNVLGIIGIVLKGTFDFGANFDNAISIIIWILSILPSYLYLKPLTEKNRIVKNKTSIKMSIDWIFMGLLVVTGIQFIISILTNENSNFDITKLIGADFTSIIGITLFIIQIAILPAIFEELLFRKAMLTVLSKYGNLVSILITSTCFALMHQNITQGVFAFFMGIILGFITIKTKSVIPAIIIHFLNNFTAAISIIALQINNTTITYISTIIIIIVLLISGIILFKNILKNKIIFKFEKTEFKINNILSCILTQYIVIITLLLYVILTIYMEIILF